MQLGKLRKIKIEGRALFISVLCGLIFVSPHFLISFLQGDGFYTPLVAKGVSGPNVEETIYASNIRDVYDGHLIVRDSQLFEHKRDANIITPWFPYLLLGMMSKITGSVINTVIIGDFVFSALTFLIVYFFIKKITKNFLVGILSGVTVLFVPHLFALTQPQYFLGSINPFNVIQLPYYYIGRLPFTQFTFIFFILAIFATYIALETGKRKFALIAGFLGGLQFYTYIYNLFGFSVGLIILFFVYFFRRDYQGLKQILTIGIVAFAIATPYLIDFISLIHSPEYSDFLSKSGVYYGRFNTLLSIRTLFYGSLIVLAYVLIRNKNNSFFTLLSFYSAGVIGLNIQLVTGYNTQPNHYWLVILQPLGVIIFSVLLHEIYKRNLFAPFSKNFKVIAIILITILLMHGLVMNISFSASTYQKFSLTQSQRELFVWLDRNTNMDDVVAMMSIENNILLPAYTHNNVFLADALVSPVPTNETVERILILYKLFDVQPEKLEYLSANKYLNTSISSYYFMYPESYESIFWSYYLFHFKFQVRLDMTKEAYLEEIEREGLDSSSVKYIISMPKEFRNKVLSDYMNYSNSPHELIKRYRIDYIVVGPYEQSMSRRDFPQAGFLKVWSNSDFSVYQVPN